MNYKYKNNTLYINSNGYNIIQSKNHYIGKIFKNLTDSINWVKKYFDNKCIELDIEIRKNELIINNFYELGLDNINNKQIYIIKENNGDNKEIISLQLESENTILSKLKQGIYYYDINITPYFALINIDNAIFEIKE